MTQFFAASPFSSAGLCSSGVVRPSSAPTMGVAAAAVPSTAPSMASWRSLSVGSNALAAWCASWAGRIANSGSCSDHAKACATMLGLV